MKNREIEKKWISNAKPEAFARLSTAFALAALEYDIVEASKLLYCDSLDNYWEGAPSAKADIVRLRHSWGHFQNGKPARLKEFTVKHKDMNCNFDRLELNNEVDSIETFRKSLNLTLGTPKFTLRKEEVILFMKMGVVASMARVWKETTQNPREGEIIVFEIEGPSRMEIKRVEVMMQGLGILDGMDVTTKSLLELFSE